MNKNRDINISYIVDGLPAGGAERQLVELLKGLAPLDCINTSLCSLSTGGAREKEAVSFSDQVIDCHGASNAGFALLLKFPLIVRRLIASFRIHKPDIVHTFGCFSDVIGAIISTKYGVTLINGSIRAARPVLNYRDRLTRRTFPYAQAIVANSSAGLRSFGMDGKGVVIHNGVEMGRFENVIPENIEGSPILCMVGNFTDKKDHMSLIGCLPVLLEQFENIKLVLVGKGKNIEKCERYATSVGCRKQIIFVNNCDSPESYIAASDICLLLSNTSIHGEGISNAIIEYMALGKPVIASDSGGNKEIVNDGHTGFLIRDNNEMQLVELINKLLNDKQQSREMGKAGKQSIKGSFSIEKMVTSYKELYESLVN